jgi:2,4-dienoyl-CoA reductase-like NADH-dependent reductase (Old Yellow Enzyme family)/thioredoxin reductase
MFPRLFEPGRIGALSLRNRLIKAPMGSGLATRDGCVTDGMIRFYRQFARGGAGLIIVENAHVDDKASKALPCQVSSSHDEHKSGLGRLAAAIKSCGAKACLQLGHAGRQKHVPLFPIKAPSRVPSEESRKAGVPDPVPLTVREIDEIVEAFGRAALRAKEAGFDVVEIVGCHGYLVSNFLSPLSNRRKDGYGGNLENRARFLLEVIGNMVDKVGKDYPLSVRLNASDYEEGGVTIEDTKKVAVAAEKAGACAIHVSGGGPGARDKVCSSMYAPPATHVWAAQEIKKLVDIPIIASGSITTPDLAERILQEGKADFISMGRPLLADPYLPQKAQEGRPEDIRPCIRCLQGCVARGRSRGFIQCAVNASLISEEEREFAPRGKPRKIAVVGGGPAGMEAARVAAQRGHNVTLFEKRKIGGALIEASVPQFKGEIRRLIDYFSVQLQRSGVTIIASEATRQTIEGGAFDAVIVATGAVHGVRETPEGNKRKKVLEALEVFRGAEIGKKVALVGGGKIGRDAALFLAEQGKSVTITTRGDDITRGMAPSERLGYLERLSKQDVQVRTGVRLVRVTPKGMVVEDGSGATSTIEADHVVFSSGLAPDRGLFDQLSRVPDLKVYAIGDCAEPRTIFDAIHEGFWTACLL